MNLFYIYIYMLLWLIKLNYVYRLFLGLYIRQVKLSVLLSIIWTQQVSCACWIQLYKWFGLIEKCQWLWQLGEYFVHYFKLNIFSNFLRQLLIKVCQCVYYYLLLMIYLFIIPILEIEFYLEKKILLDVRSIF